MSIGRGATASRLRAAYTVDRLFQLADDGLGDSAALQRLASDNHAREDARNEQDQRDVLDRSLPVIFAKADEEMVELRVNVALYAIGHGLSFDHQ